MKAVSIENLQCITSDLYDRIKNKASKKELSDAKKYARQYSDARKEELQRQDELLDEADHKIASEESVGHIKSSNEEGQAKVDQEKGTVTINPKHAILEEIEATQWLSGQTYDVNTIISYQKKNYICIREHSSSLNNTPDKSTVWREIIAPNLYGETNGQLQVTVDINSTNKEVYIPINYTQNKMPFPHISVYQVVQPDGDVVITHNCYDLREQIDYKDTLGLMQMTPEGLTCAPEITIHPRKTVNISNKYMTEYEPFYFYTFDKNYNNESMYSREPGSYYILSTTIEPKNSKMILLDDDNVAYGLKKDQGYKNFRGCIVAENWLELSDNEKLAIFDDLITDEDALCDWNMTYKCFQASYKIQKAARIIMLHDEPNALNVKMTYNLNLHEIIFPEIITCHLGKVKSVKALHDSEEYHHSLSCVQYYYIINDEPLIKETRSNIFGGGFVYENHVDGELHDIRTDTIPDDNMKKMKKMRVAIITYWQSQNENVNGKIRSYFKGIEYTFAKAPEYKNMIIGKDYNYEYIANNVLKVSFNNNDGKYVINYSA